MSPHRQDNDILIRPLAANDAPALHAAVRSSIDSLSYWLPWCHPGYALADAQEWIAYCIAAWENGTEFPFGIFDSHSGELIGSVGLSHVNRANRSANLGYWVAESQRGRGIAARAVALAASVGFEDLGLVRLEIVALTHNLASQRVAEKVGAVREVEARNRLMFQGSSVAAVVYSLKPGDVAANGSAEPKATG